jgi:hypothetical protein
MPSKGLGQRQARGLDDNRIQRAVPRQQLVHGRNEIVGDSAADTAVGKFDDIARRRPCGALPTSPLSKPGVAEFIDDHGRAAIGLRQQRTQQRGLAGAEKARVQ